MFRLGREQRTVLLATSLRMGLQTIFRILMQDCELRIQITNRMRRSVLVGTHRVVGRLGCWEYEERYESVLIGRLELTRRGGPGGLLYLAAVHAGLGEDGSADTRWRYLP